MRQGDDPLDFDLLQQLKGGKLKMYHKLYLMSQCVDVDGHIPLEFADAVQVVSSNATRQELSKLAFQMRYAESGSAVAIHAANDWRPNGHPIRKDLRDFLLQVEDKRSDYMPSVLYLAPGHEVVLKTNMAVELGLCNGTRAFIRSWVEDPREPKQHADKQIRVLRYPPLYILAEVKRDSEDDVHRFTLPGLEPGCFPIAPEQTSMKLTNLHRKGLPYGDITVARRMPRVLPAQSVTGHGAQGMTLSKVVPGCRPACPSCFFLLSHRTRLLHTTHPAR